MLRILSLSLVLVSIIYFLPFMTGEKELSEIEILEVSEFKIEDIEFINSSSKIPVLIDGEVVNIDMDEYLIGVVSAEMPASFEEEALKAQAVAARTYIHYKNELIKSGKADGVHNGAIVCDDHTHCKAYIDLDKENPWGNDYEMYKEKIEEAVYSTSGEIIVYNDEPIASVFHAASSGNTESSKDVWGGEIPYLIPVISEGSKDSPKYSDETIVSFDDFKNAVTKRSNNVVLPPDTIDWFKNSSRSESGGIIEVYIGGVAFTGQSIRDMFSLNSTNFTVSFDESNVIFKTLGYGHGVGMSQYGANGLAKEGKDYKEILTWYYTDTKILEKEFE